MWFYSVVLHPHVYIFSPIYIDSNINLQMNYWAAETTGLGDVTGSLWDYMQVRGVVFASFISCININWTLVLV